MTTSTLPPWAAPADVGAHFAGADPAAEASRAHRDETPDLTSHASREDRGWRVREYRTPSPGPATDDGTAGSDRLAAVHAQAGHPDPNGRALWSSPVQAGRPGHISDDLSPAAEQLVNDPAGANVVDAQNAPVRRAQGFTGEDNTRSATQSRWLFGRLFDQWAEQRLGSVDKVPSSRMAAATPPTFGQDVAGAVPSPGGGWRATGMIGVGLQPNSARLLPRAWDEQLVNEGPPGDPAARAASSSRAAGWRLR